MLETEICNLANLKAVPLLWQTGFSQPPLNCHVVAWMSYCNTRSGGFTAVQIAAFWVETSAGFHRHISFHEVTR
jgi:hypothetical protein